MSTDSDVIDSKSELLLQAITSEDSTPFLIDKTAYTIQSEGKAQVLFPNSHDVFYNPVQEFNRDLSIAVIREHAKELREKNLSKCNSQSEDGVTSDNFKGITILEAFAASGLRSIRYALEIPYVKRVVANDVSSQAVESIHRNIEYNKLQEIITANEEDASLYMYQHRKHKDRFDVIDLDPYGSPSAFLDAAVQSVVDGGLLLITCTDTAILCGNSSETCYAKYGAMSLKSKCCHEMALRIVLHSIESRANCYGRYIVPILSLSVDFYVRLFVRVFTSQSKVKESASKQALVFQCSGCETFSLQPLGRCYKSENGKNMKFSPATAPNIGIDCKFCGHKHKLGGPIWSDRIHDREFVEKVLNGVESMPTDFKTSKRLQGMLSLVLEELPDVPLYHSLDRLAGTLHITCPKMILVRSAILNAGYRVSYSHALKTSIKTDAPPDLIWDIFRAWAKLNPVKRELSVDAPAKLILETKPSYEVSFEEHPDASPESKKNKLLRFQENPEKFWGPKMKAKSSLRSETQMEKSKRMQGKRSHHQQVNNDDTKRFLCKRFKQGQCSLGEECKYSHNME